MPIVRFLVDANNCSDDRLRGYRIDVRTLGDTDPDSLLLWVQNIAIGVIDDGWTSTQLIEDAIDIRILDGNRKTLIDTLYQ